MMQTKSFLENIVLSCIDHPKTLAMGVGAFSFLYPFHTGDWEPSLWTSATPAYLTYLTLGGIREHLFSRDYRDMRTDSLAERTRRYVFDRIKPLTIVSGAALASVYYLLASPQGAFVEEHPPRLIGEYATQIVWPATMAVNQITLSLFKQHHRVMQSLRAWKERHLLNDQQHTLAERVARGWNFLFEHPLLVGLMAGGYHLFNNCPEGGVFPQWDNVECGLRTTYVTALGTFGAAVVGGLLHTSGLAYYKNTLLAHTYRFLGKRKDATASLEKTLALPTSHAMMIERHVAVADALLDNGDERKAMKYYREAAILFSHPENQRLASPDLLQHLLFRRHVSLEHRFEQIGESMNEVVAYVPSHRSQQCFLFKRGGNRPYVEHEYHLNKALELILRKEGSTVKPPHSVLCFQGRDGKTYHAMLREHTPSLEQNIRRLDFFSASRLKDDEEQFCEYIALATSFIARLHIDATKHLHQDERGFFLMPPDGAAHRVPLSQRSYGEEFVGRVMTGKSYDSHPRLGPVGYAPGRCRAVDAFVERALEYFAPLHQHQTFFTHGDLALRHVLMNGTLLDFERAAVGNPLVDIAGFYADARVPASFFAPRYLAAMEKNGVIFTDAQEQIRRAEVYHFLCNLGTMIGRLPHNALRRHYVLRRFSREMNFVCRLLQEHGNDELKTALLDALAHSGLQYSPYLDYHRMMKELHQDSLGPAETQR